MNPALDFSIFLFISSVQSLNSKWRGKGEEIVVLKQIISDIKFGSFLAMEKFGPFILTFSIQNMPSFHKD